MPILRSYLALACRVVYWQIWALPVSRILLGSLDIDLQVRIAALADDRHALDGKVFQQEKRACDISCTSISLRLFIRVGSLFIG
jgi:hypothetical protein